MNGSQYDVDLQIPELVASTPAGGSPIGGGTYEANGTGTSTAGGTFVWVPDHRETPDDNVVINHTASLSGSLDANIDNIMGGPGYAKTMVSFGGTTNHRERCIAATVVINDSIYISQKNQFQPWGFYMGPNGVVTRTINPTFNSSLYGKASAASGLYPNAQGEIVNMNRAFAKVSATTLKTTSISVSQ